MEGGREGGGRREWRFHLVKINRTRERGRGRVTDGKARRD